MMCDCRPARRRSEQEVMKSEQKVEAEFTAKWSAFRHLPEIRYCLRDISHTGDAGSV